MKIKFLKQHEHDGKQYAPGDVVELHTDAAVFLTERGIAENVKKQPKSNPQSTENSK